MIKRKGIAYWKANRLRPTTMNQEFIDAVAERRLKERIEKNHPELKTCMHCDIEQEDFIIEDDEAIILGHYCGGKDYIESYARESDIKEYINTINLEQDDNRI